MIRIETQTDEATDHAQSQKQMDRRINTNWTLREGNEAVKLHSRRGDFVQVSVSKLNRKDLEPQRVRKRLIRTESVEKSRFMSLNNMAHKRIPTLKTMKNLGAKAAFDKEWTKLHTLLAWEKS